MSELSTTAGPEGTGPESTGPESKTTRRWLGAFGTVLGMRGLGLAFLPVLLVQAPIILVVLAPLAAYLVLAAPRVAPWAYFVGAMTASVLHSAIAYQCGVVLGDKAQDWIEHRGGSTHAAVERISWWLKRAAPLVLLFSPGPIVCALAGAAGVRGWVFHPTQILAHALWISACFWFGAAVTEQLDAVHHFFETYLIELSLVALFGAGGRYLWTRWRGEEESNTHDGPVDAPPE